MSRAMPRPRGNRRPWRLPAWARVCIKFKTSESVMLKQHITPSRRKILVAAASAALALLVWGDKSSAGIEGTGRRTITIAHGRITAFGSIFVDGVEFEIARAKIHINGHAARATQLAVGQIVTVQGFVNGP